MNKRVIFVFSLFLLFILSSCDNLLVQNFGKNQLAFQLGSAGDGISKTISTNNSITEDTELKIDFELYRGSVFVERTSEITTVKNLSETVFQIKNIPNGNNYFLNLKIYYENILIYKADSDRIILNEKGDDACVSLKLKQMNSHITYEFNGGEFTAGTKMPVNYFLNSVVSLPSPVKTHYRFDGWFDNEELTGERITELGKNRFVGDIKLYAKWISLDQTAGVIFSSGSGADGSGVDCGDVITLQSGSSGAKIYYTLNGDVPTINSTLYTSINVTEDIIDPVSDKIIIKAIAVKDGLEPSEVAVKEYTRNRYTVSFNNNGNGTKPEDVTSLKKNDVVSKPSDLTADGYAFEGWYTTPECSDGSLWDFTSNKVEKSFTLYGKWTKVTVDITTSGGKIDFKDKITIEATPASAEIFYTVDGTEPTASSTKYDKNIGIVVDDSLIGIGGETFKVQAIATYKGATSALALSSFELKKYTVTLDNKGHGTFGPEGNSFTGKKRGDIINLPKLNEIDLTFGGWTNNGSLVDYSYTVTGDVTLNAEWTKKGALEKVLFTPSQKDISSGIDYGETIELTSGDGTSGAKIYYTTDNSDPSNSPTRTEYTVPITITGDITIKAVAQKGGQSDSALSEVSYKLKKYNLNFDNNGKGDVPGAIKLHKDEIISSSSLPSLTATGYSLEGWYKDSGLNTKVNAGVDKMGIKDMTLYAKWTPITFSVKFDPNGGSGTMNNQILTFDKAEALNANTFVKSGYEFAGWNIKKTGATEPNINDGDSKAFNFTSVQDGEVILYAQWKNIAPGAVKSLTAQLIGNSAKLTWTNPADEDLAKVIITSSDGTINKEDASMEAVTPGAEGTYTVQGLDSATASYTFKVQLVDNEGLGSDLIPEATVQMPVELTVGDIVYSDGSVSKNAKSGVTAVAVIFSVDSNGKALGVGLKESQLGIQWAPNGSTGYKTIFATSETDGKGNWSVIQSSDSTGASSASTNYPAFDYVNNYGSVHSGLSGTNYVDGWYMPSKEELRTLCKAASSINTTIESAHGTKLSGNYFSSSQHPTIEAYIMKGDITYNTIEQIYKDSTACKVRCIREF